MKSTSQLQQDMHDEILDRAGVGASTRDFDQSETYGTAPPEIAAAIVGFVTKELESAAPMRSFKLRVYQNRISIRMYSDRVRPGLFHGGNRDACVFYQVCLVL